jgi:hypothetical protein
MLHREDPAIDPVEWFRVADISFIDSLGVREAVTDGTHPLEHMGPIRISSTWGTVHAIES